MDELRVQAYLTLIQVLLDCPGGEENEILNGHRELLDEGFVQVCEAVAAQLQGDGQENQAGFLWDVARDVGAFVAREGMGGNEQGTLQQFWLQLLQAENEGDTAAVHQVMRQNMGLIVPNLGDTIAQSVQGYLAENPDEAEDIAGLVENTCNSIQQFPYGRYAEALEIAIRGYGVVLELRADNPPKRAQTMTNLGVARSIQAQMGIDPAANLDGAIAAYDQAAEILRRLGLEKDLSSTLANLGSARLTQAQMGINPAANLDGAITAYDEAARISRRLELGQDLSGTLTGLGAARWSQAQMGIDPATNLDGAITAYGEAAGISRRLGLEKDLSDTLNNLGNAHLTQAEMGIDPAANLDGAIAAYNEAAGIQRQLGLDKNLSTALNNLGNARSTQARMGINPVANLDEAIAAYNEAAEIQRQLGLDKDLSNTLTNLGFAHSTQAKMGIEPGVNLEWAIVAYNEATFIRRQLGLEKDLSGTLTNLGFAHSIQADMGIDPGANLEMAITAYDEAARILRGLGLDKNLSETLTGLGIAHLTQAEMGMEPRANIERAITACNEAAGIRRRLGLEKDLSDTLNNLGNARLTQADIGIEPAANLQSAIGIYDEAAGISRRLGLEKDLSDTLNNLGNARTTQAQMGINPAANLNGAIAAYSEATVIRRKLGLEKDLSNTLNNLGAAHDTQAEMGIEPGANLERAIKAYDQAAEIRRRLGLARNLAGTLNNFGLAYQAQSRLAGISSTQKQQALENAYRSFQEALERVEYLRGEIGADSEGYKRNFNEEWNRVYRGMVEVCLELGRYQDAIEYVDRSKARNLVELIATRDAYPGGVMPDDIHQQLQSLKIAIAQAERRLQDEENPDPTHLNQLRQQKQELEPYKPLHFEGMQKLLDKETAILEWYILGDKFLTFTLTGQGTGNGEQGTGNGEQNRKPWTSSKEDLKNLSDWGLAYLTDYYTNKDQWRETLADRLAELPKILHLDEILSNLFKTFPTCQKLILIPHLYLHLFPLHALPIPVVAATDEKGAQRLRPIFGQNGNQEDASIAPLQDLFPNGVTYAPNCQLLQQAQNRPRPHFNRLLAIQNPTNDLNWAEIEVETIRNIFPQQETLTRENARLATFLNKNLPQTHHLFFSCHGSFNPNSPLDSGLRLADGVLTLEQIIATLNLKACSLVTLSACETGQVALDDTDEYISIASGFLLAGSPSVLMSLWSVDEASTALLLIKTYETLNQHPGQLTTALQTAQTWLRETTNSGFYDWVQKSPLLDDHWRNLLAQVFQTRQNKEGANCRPYESPYHWAAFCIVGQGEQKNGTGQRQN